MPVIPQAASRETVMAALLNLLSEITAAGAPLKSYGRRVRDPDNVSSSDRPALFLVEHLDSWRKQAVNLPPVREMTVWALLYTDVGTNENLIPMTQVNLFIESIEWALAPDFQNRCTLGGLVFNAMLDGEGIRASGDTTGKSLAALPIKIILNGPLAPAPVGS